MESLFSSVFAEIECEAEGSRVGILASELMGTTDRHDLCGMPLFRGPQLDEL